MIPLFLLAAFGAPVADVELSWPQFLGPGGLASSPAGASPPLTFDRARDVHARLARGSDLDRISHNVLASDSTLFDGTPAVSGSRLFLRSHQALYCIE